jgi:predicted RNase H-like nuclease (RuvC/YqgF family)
MNNYTFPNTKEYKTHKFSELLSRLQNMFDSVREENSNLYKKIAEFSKDKAIQEWQTKYAHARSHSLHELSEKELDLYTNFRVQHYKSCHNGSTFTITLSGTGIGEVIEVACPVCGRKQDITDTESW